MHSTRCREDRGDVRDGAMMPWLASSVLACEALCASSSPELDELLHVPIAQPVGVALHPDSPLQVAEQLVHGERIDLVIDAQDRCAAPLKGRGIVARDLAADER